MRPDEAAVPPFASAPGRHRADEDEHIGAVEGDRPTDLPNQGNPHGAGVNSEGMPDDPLGTAEDRIGANLDESEGG